MIHYLQNDMIDKSRWDDCIGSAVNGNLNAWSWYLDIVSPGWCALVENDYESVFPLTTFSRAGIKYLMQPYFTQQLGLYFKALSSENALNDFLNHIPLHYKYIDINLNTSNQIVSNGIFIEMTNLELDLISDYDKIYSGYHVNLKRNLKKAVQQKLSLSKNVRPEEITSLFKANKGQDLKHLSDKQYQQVQRIAYESISKGIGEIWGAYDEFNQLVASVLWITSHRKSVFLFSAVSGDGKKLQAMPWLIDLFIQENVGSQLTLDFEGSNDAGLARFYSSFGAKKVIYHRYIKNSLPYLYRILLNIWRISRIKLKKVLPL
jgi:hypothetical protein